MHVGISDLAMVNGPGLQQLRCASGVGVTALNCCGLLQSLMIIVIACH